jgi:hypothetical protein
MKDYLRDKVDLDFLSKNIRAISKREMAGGNEKELVSDLNSFIKESYETSKYIFRGIGHYGEMKIDELIDRVLKPYDDRLIISSRRSYQSWSLNPAIGFYYGCGSRGDGFVLMVDKSYLDEREHKLVRYDEETRNMNGKYDNDLNYGLWREMEVRTRRNINIPKKALIVIVSNKRLYNRLRDMGFNVVLSRSFYTEESFILGGKNIGKALGVIES